MELEDLQNSLLGAGIQVDKKMLQNPTDEFMIYITKEYLTRFGFDGNAISKPTEEQLSCLSCPDSAPDAVKIINLYSALCSICVEIYLKDFCLTDICSPLAKKARKQMKILFNFFAYFKNKMVENESAFEELAQKQKNIEDLRQEKESLILQKGASISERENKLELNLKVQQEIDAIRLEMEDYSKLSQELASCAKSLLTQHQEIHKHTSDLKTKADKLHKKTQELQSKIVKSPEEYAAKTKELNQLLEVRKEERQVVNDSITKKKLQIKNNELAQELVKYLNDTFNANTSGPFKQLRDALEKVEAAQKELKSLKKDIAKLMNNETDSSNTSLKQSELKEYEQLLIELEHQFADKERELLSHEKLVEKLIQEIKQRIVLVEEKKKIILTVQEKNANLLSQYSDHFSHEIHQELKLRDELQRMFMS